MEKKEYTAGGYRFVECAVCGERVNAGQPWNGTGERWSQGIIANWWARHSKTPLVDWADMRFDNLPCSSLAE